jgi:hypothetical protein
LGWADPQGIFKFALHRDKRTGDFDQHNALFRLLERRKQATYVAPLFYRRTRLKQFRSNGRRAGPAWSVDAAHIKDTHDGSVSKRIRVRSFEDFISIPPHRFVKNAGSSHWYSYDHHRRVCFHTDPEPLEEVQSDLSRFISRIAAEEEFQPLSRFAATAWGDLLAVYDRSRSSTLFERRIQNAVFEVLGYQAKFATLDPVDTFRVLESVLKSDFNVIQYLAVREVG